jgi:NifU-like protein involved in Fe-S cluster formation
VTARQGAALYTPELLALAVALADYPLDPALPHEGAARSRTCGSTVKLRCSIDQERRIAAAGVQAAACAVGQAAAALFVRHAPGLGVEEIARSREELAAWLEGGERSPTWPGIEILAAARAHNARHGAILLAWDAALAALSKAEVRG